MAQGLEAPAAFSMISEDQCNAIKELKRNAASAREAATRERKLLEAEYKEKLAEIHQRNLATPRGTFWGADDRERIASKKRDIQEARQKDIKEMTGRARLYHMEKKRMMERVAATPNGTYLSPEIERLRNRPLCVTEPPKSARF